MDLSKYEEITGVDVPESKEAFVQAQLNRTQSILESLLGYTLTPEETDTNFYNELGKSTSDCACPSVAINEDSLADPDEVVGAYRLFPYNSLDQYLHIDPFSQINAVKLVYVKPGSGTTGITLKTFTTDQIRLQIGREGFSKYLELCRTCWCTCECDGCVQLAVDAEWLWDDQDDIPLELLYVQADMVQYYSDPKRNIKRESITTHSYEKFDNTPPQAMPDNLAIIKKYAGPNGTASSMPTEGASGRRVSPWV